MSTYDTVTVGRGTAVHFTPSGTGYTVCGSEGRTPGATTLHLTDAAVTCKRCIALRPDVAAAPTPAPATRAPRTWDAEASSSHVCAGACKQEKPARSFPTTGKPGRRGVVCRACRDAGKVVAA